MPWYRPERWLVNTVTETWQIIADRLRIARQVLWDLNSGGVYRPLMNGEIIAIPFRSGRGLHISPSDRVDVVPLLAGHAVRRVQP